jgi:response regulator RpfG family c-di-GMP phosphodiesterase
MDYQHFVTTETDMIVQNLISVWIDLLEARSLETKAHCERVSLLAVRFAQKLGMSHDEQKAIFFGAQLHDIGDLGVQDAVLLKKEKLSEEEFQAIRQHPLFAKKMIEDSPYLAAYVSIPLFHHEYWNGKGYPFGRQQEEIPLEARVFALVDTWDALTNDRPFRKALSKEVAEKALEDGKASQFEPHLVDVFIEMLNEKQSVQNGSELILVVDDEPYLRLALKDLFIREGYVCQVAGSGKEALGILENVTPSLIISDIMMPSMNGFDFRRALKAVSDELADIPFIFLTAKTTQIDKTEGYELEIDDYITKPFEPTELLAKVKAILRRSKMIKKQVQSDYDRQMSDLTHVITRNTTHELKSPLGIIIGNLEVVMRKFSKLDDPLIAPCLTDAQTSARRLQTVIDELLYLYKVDNRISAEEMFPVDIQKDILAVIDEVKQIWSTKNISIHTDIAETLRFSVPIEGFSHALYQLMDNACKFASEDGSVWFSLHAEERDVVITIENDGEKIPAALKDKVFDRFFQVSNGDNRNSSGLGLGLAIARNFAESCGGSIEFLESKIGAKISLRFPLIIPSANPSREAASPVATVQVKS